MMRGTELSGTPSRGSTSLGRTRRRAVLGLVTVVALVAAGLTIAAVLRDPDTPHWAAADGSACDGWVSTASVEAALGGNVAGTEVTVRRTPGLGTIVCEVHAGDELVLSLESWTAVADQRSRHLDIDHARTVPGAVEGPLDGSVIAPEAWVPGSAGTVGSAVIDVGDGLRQVVVRVPAPADGVDTHGAIGRLIQELARSAAEEPPRPGSGGG